MRAFVHQSAPARVVLAAGALARVPEELEALGATRVAVVAGGSCGPAGDQLARDLGTRCVARLRRVVPHVPEALVAEATAAVRAAGADALCCIGGGSATGLAKAVAVALDLPVLAVPTTYAGSEATDIYGVTGQHKRTATDPRARPRTVVYDPQLSTGLSDRVTVTSAFNALAHAVAALGGRYEPVARMYAAEAARLLVGALPAARHDPEDLAARADLLWAAWLAGSALAATGTGLHHRLCHLLGGDLGLVHAEVHTVLLPHTVAVDEGLDRDSLARVLGRDPAAVLGRLAEVVRAPRSLRELGVPANRLDELAGQAADRIGGHDRAWFRDLLDRAYHHPERSQL